MRPSLRNLAMLLLWVVALWPLALWVVHALAPPAAVGAARSVGLWGGRVGLGALGAGAALALAWPPFLPRLRLWFVHLRERLRQDPARLHETLTQLQHLETAAGRLEAGRLLLAAGRRTEARDQLLRAVQLAPDLVGARFLLGRTLRLLRHHGPAAQVLADVVAAEPDHAFGEARMELGIALLHAGRLADAAQVLEQHRADHGPTRRNGWWRGVLHRRLGDRAAAHAALREAAAPPPPGTRLSPRDAWYRARARAALWTWGRRP